MRKKKKNQTHNRPGKCRRGICGSYEMTAAQVWVCLSAGETTPANAAATAWCEQINTHNLIIWIILNNPLHGFHQIIKKTQQNFVCFLSPIKLQKTKRINFLLKIQYISSMFSTKLVHRDKNLPSHVKRKHLTHKKPNTCTSRSATARKGGVFLK